VEGLVGGRPPCHNDVFILTHYPRDPVEMEGGTTFHVVTDGIERALELAREAAYGRDVRLEQVRAVEAPGLTHVKYRVLSARDR
jgi:hypothetical protein